MKYNDYCKLKNLGLLDTAIYKTQVSIITSSFTHNLWKLQMSNPGFSFDLSFGVLHII